MIRPLLRVRRRVLASAALIAASAAASVALAQPPPAAVDPGLQAAKAEFEEAQALYVREAFDDAAARFLSAYDKKPFPAFLFNAAVASEKAKQYGRAIELFGRYLDREPNASDAAEVRARIESLTKLIAPPPPPPPSGGAPPLPGEPAPAPVAKPILPAIETKGLVIVDSKPAGATIYLDDKKKGAFAKTPWQGSLEPKPVKLLIEAKGFKPEERSIVPRADKILEVYIALSEEHFLGWIEIAGNVAGADVYIDRRDIGAIGRTPYTGHVKPGKHTIWVEKAGYKPTSREIDVQPGTATTHMVNLDRVDVGWIAVVGKQTKGGKLKVNGKEVCTTPCQHEVAPGRYEIRIDQKDVEPFEGEVEVAKATQTVVEPRFSPKPSRSRGWTAGIMSAAFLGAGIYLGLQANGIEKDIKDDVKDPTLLVDTSDDRATKGKYYAIGADVAFGLAALTGIMSLVNFLSSGPDSTADIDQKQIGFAPIGLPGGGGVSAVGRF